MRHTRIKQLEKVNKCKYSKNIGNLKISDVRESLYGWRLDKTFKWYRESDYGENWIELGGDGYRYGVLLQAKACYKTLKGLTK
ncbi:hypothetical protein [Bacillus cereus group sp. RP43]|uniref:hypothetical protein n=1 Tax=Bacillus cereus group sp. RP43 TaxID=3040260 RepID=UPI0033965827